MSIYFPDCGQRNLQNYNRVAYIWKCYLSQIVSIYFIKPSLIYFVQNTWILLILWNRYIKGNQIELNKTQSDA